MEQCDDPRRARRLRMRDRQHQHRRPDQNRNQEGQRDNTGRMLYFLGSHGALAAMMVRTRLTSFSP
ncbi:hypothetical protein [Thauera humireducens]|uniref:hypothetical protein n=1 Tax=Thauera humireducens TaxID=1134435 RepID=UPI00311F605E